eukprot:TRINITY_DN4952_c0_g2_i1.p1 TRINITY_DN4952_c0_g2~~TRINITY_DN4952_c0_g2_i1.p1  ORF type:complete len:752 (-),score=183.04 TRINITY_DN4952_c0_g2_i1:29-2215(-)
MDNESRHFSPTDRDSRTFIEKEMNKLYNRQECQRLCDQILHVPLLELETVILVAAQEKRVLSILEESEKYSELKKQHPVELYRVFAEVLLENDFHEEAFHFAQKAHASCPTDPKVCLLLVIAMTRRGGISTLPDAFSHIREALRLDPTSVISVHTYASLLLQIMMTNGLDHIGVPVKTLLSELRKTLDHPDVNHLLVADCGMRLWFKMLEEHTNELMAEEQRNVQNSIPPDESYIYSLTRGAFSKLCLEPFFEQSLSQVVFSNPGLETVLIPFRSAVATLRADPQNFQTLETFIHALALQCFRNNYSWPVSDDDLAKLRTLETKIGELLIKPVEEIVVDNVLIPELYRQLSLVALFKPLHQVPGLGNVLRAVDLTKCHQWFVALVNKTLFEYEEEQQIKANIVRLTEINETDNVVMFRESHVPVWDTAGLSAGRLTKITFQQELKWLAQKYQPKEFSTPVQILFAGCGSGSELYQYATLYKDVEFTAFDVSRNNLAFAIRQCRALGVTNVKFFLADVNKLEPKDFPQLFDVVIANLFVDHFEDPMQAWQRLSKLLKSGGVMKMSVASGRCIDMLRKARSYLNATGAFSPSLFTNETPLPLLRRTPTQEEVRRARNLILGVDERDLEDLRELVTSPQFYTLEEFTDIVFHPQIVGFSFDAIGKCLQALQLRLVSFEFAALAPEIQYRYEVEYPDDPEMNNVDHLEAFSTKYPDAFRNFTNSIAFIAEKP